MDVPSPSGSREPSKAVSRMAGAGAEWPEVRVVPEEPRVQRGWNWVMDQWTDVGL